MYEYNQKLKDLGTMDYLESFEDYCMHYLGVETPIIITGYKTESTINEIYKEYLQELEQSGWTDDVDD